MLNIIVPLAGSDFVDSAGGVKGMLDFDGSPLTKYILESRPWHSQYVNYTFVLQDIKICREFYSDQLTKWFPNSKPIFISTITQGAALSALVGISTLNNFNSPLIVDLADIYFEIPYFENKNYFPLIGLNGTITFSSTEDHYSYLRFDESGKFLEAKEKEVISDSASAGVYFFNNAQTYIAATNWCMRHGKRYNHNGLFYVCPLFNGVTAAGKVVNQYRVSNIKTVKNTI